MAIFNLMKHILFALLLCLPLASRAEEKPVKVKNLLSEAKTAIKNSRNQANAEKNLMAVVNRDDVTREKRAEIYFMGEELQRSQNDAENMKLYLKQTYDTVKFFSTILRMHEYLLLCDSVESLPDEQGLVKYKYRSKGREVMKAYRTNLLNGGKFLLKRNKYADAFPYFDVYLKTARHPIFEDYPSFKGDTLLPHVAYWATIAAYNANQPARALAHIDEAIGGAKGEVRVSLQEYKVRCYEVLKQDSLWFENLLLGAKQYPAHDYFFLHLMDEYMQREAYDKGIALCDTMLQQVGNRSIYWYGESQMFLARKEFDETIRTADEALKCDSLMADAYYNKGIAYLNKAVIFAETVCNDVRDPKCRKDRQILQDLYREAKQPMEQLRKLAPEDSKRWAMPLYRIYLNLNRGAEFAEMEKIVNAQ